MVKLMSGRLRHALIAAMGLVLAFGVAGVGASGEAAAGPPHSGQNFVAPLEGGQEVPPVDTDGRGLAKFELSKDGTELHYKLIVANIENVTQAHIHVGARGENGGVEAFLFGFVDGGVTQNGVLAEGVITDAEVAEAGGIESLDELVAEMRDGNTYVNVHTVANPPGEIRGQIGALGPRH